LEILLYAFGRLCAPDSIALLDLRRLQLPIKRFLCRSRLIGRFAQAGYGPKMIVDLRLQGRLVHAQSLVFRSKRSQLLLIGRTSPLQFRNLSRQRGSSCGSIFERSLGLVTVSLE